MKRSIKEIIERDTGKTIEEIQNTDWDDLEKYKFFKSIYIFFDKILFFGGMV